MYIVGTLKLTALPGEDDDDDDDDEAGDAAEECNDDEDNGDGMQMPSALEQRVFEEAGAEAEDDKGDDDDASVTSSLEEFVGDAGSLNFEQDIHGAEISPEEASLANQELAASRFVLASESYGGHFIPAFAEAIFNFNDRTPAETIQIAGMVFSSTCIDKHQQGLESFTRFAKKEPTSKDAALTFGEYAYLGAPGISSKRLQEKLLPSHANPSSMSAARYQVWSHINYLPNTYDYRLASAGPCCGCMGYNYSDFDRWFTHLAVRKALNVCGDAGADSFAGCGAGCIVFPGEFDAYDDADNVQTMSKVLEMKIPILMAYGMKDATCNYVGGYSIASSLRWAGAEQWANAPLQPFYLGHEVAGKEQMSVASGFQEDFRLGPVMGLGRTYQTSSSTLVVLLLLTVLISFSVVRYLSSSRIDHQPLYNSEASCDAK
eukprot:g8708.t1